MSRRHIHAWALLGLALLFGSCTEKLELLGPQIVAPDSLRGTIGDTLLFTSIYLGDGSDVARHSWDFNSDGIIDFVWTNFGDSDTLVVDGDTLVFDGNMQIIGHAYSSTGEYTATLQITTVGNRLFRSHTPVRITDGRPQLAATVSDSVGCGETILLSGTASDDAGLRAFWDLDGDGIPDLSADFVDSVTLEAEVAFDEPGVYPFRFSASDNDGHLEALDFAVTVGVAPEWTDGAAMSQPRADHAAAVFGGEIYVFGGRHGRGATGRVEIYDPVGDNWRDGADMPTPRWGLQAVAIGDSIFVAGGVTMADTIFPYMEIYDPVGDAWETFPADTIHAMPLPRRGFAMLEVGEKYAGGDSLLLVGGTTGGEMIESNLIYNTHTRSWSIDTNPNSPLSPGRAWLDAVTVWNDEAEIGGRMFALGGTGDGITPSGIFERYIPFNDFWTGEPPLPTPRIAPALAQHGGKLYVFGGSLGIVGATDVVEVFSLTTELWDAVTPMPLARSGAVAVTLEGRIYVIGGATEFTSPYHVEGSVELQVLVPWRCAP